MKKIYLFLLFVSTGLMADNLISDARNPDPLSSVSSIVQDTFRDLASGDGVPTGTKLKESLERQLLSTTENGINRTTTNFINEKMPGKTEFSIRNITSDSPSIKFITIQPLSTLNSNSREATLIQASAENNSGSSTDDITLNLGVIKRFLSPDQQSIVGANAFLDYQVDSGHKRTGLGLEIKRNNFTLNYNKYFPLSREITIGKYRESVMKGYDVRLLGQVPYTPWAKFRYNKYNWQSSNNDEESSGRTIGVDFDLNKFTTLKLTRDFNGNTTSSLTLNIKLPFDNKASHQLPNFTPSKFMFEKSSSINLSTMDFVNRQNLIKIHKRLNGKTVEIGVFNSTTTNSTCTLLKEDGSIIKDVHGRNLSGVTNSAGIVIFENAMIEAGIVVVECSGGTYLDEATGNNSSLSSQKSSLIAKENTDLFIYVTPVSDIIHNLANEDGDLSDINTKRSVVDNSFGLSTSLVRPDDINLVVANSSNESKYGLVLAAISQMAASANTTQDLIIGELKLAIKSDGRLSPNKVTTAIRELAENPTAPASKNITDTSISELQADKAEIPAFIFSKVPSEMQEGSSDEYFIKITTEPVEQVSLLIQSPSELTITPSELLFTNLNWWKENKITILANEDVNIDDQSFNVNHEVSGSEYSTVDIPSMEISIIDNDIATILVSNSSGSTSEAGTTATFTVVLTSEPTADVVIPISSTDVSEGIVSKSSLTFTPSNWNISQTVTVTGTDDNIVDANISYNIVVGASASDDANYNENDITEVAMINLDNDNANILVSSISGDTSEDGTSATFTVVLTSEPTTDVVIPLTSSNFSEGIVSVSSVTFTPSNWNITQTITVTGVDDFVIDGNTLYYIIIASASSEDVNYNNTPGTNLTVINQENDTANISVSIISGNTSEAGTTATFTITLTSQPKFDVIVPFASSDTSEGTTSTPSITFTHSNWNISQTVTVTGTDDNVKDGNKDFTIVFSGTTSLDSDYNDLLASSLNVINLDNDVANIVISSISGSTSEAGSIASFTLSLTSEPTADVTIPVSSSDTTEGTVSVTSITFTPSNWDIAQTITLTGINDDVQDGDISYQLLIGVSISIDTIYSNIDIADVTVINQDNDIANIVISAISGATSEAGSIASFTLSLASEPTADVTIPVSSSDTTEGMVSAASITFTATNWNTSQTINITGVDDDINDGDIDFKILIHASASTDINYNNINKPDISLINQDNDVANIVVSAISGSTSEAGSIASFLLSLTSEPTSDVTIPVSSSDTTEGTVSVASITFTPSNWDIAQTITITGVDDDIKDGDIDFKILIHASASTDINYNNINKPDISLINQDNDVANIVVSAISGSTSEAGAIASFTLLLTSEPTADVTIPVSSSDTTEGTVSVASITFTTTNWNTPQTITITGVDDEVQDGEISYNILLGSSISLDPNYNAINKPDLNLINQDDDVANISVSQISGSTSEAGSIASFTLSLTSEPTSDVTIPVSSSDTTEGTVSVTSITFTTTNWNTPQTITITGVDDEVQDGEISYNILLGSSISLDPNYNAINKPNLNLINQDDDVANISVSQISGSTSEDGTTAWITMVLTSEPTGDVVIPVSSSDITEGVMAQSIITFTTNNWNTIQTIVIAGVNDMVQDGDINYNVMLDAAVSTDGNYNGVVFEDIAVLNTDNDVANIIVSTVSGNTAENGETASFTMVLTSEPTSDVTIPISSSDTSEGTVSVTAVTFTPISWNTSQTITITGVDDTELDSDMGYTITLGNPATLDPIYAAKVIADINLININDDFQISLASLKTMIANGDDVTQVDTSAITDMSDLFYYNGTFNQDISSWDVSSVTTMSRMFKGANVFNQDIGGWDVSKVTNMSQMLEATYDFNQDIGGWDVSSVTSMRNMLRSMYTFNQDISSWDTSNVTDMSSMFYSNYSFNSDISNWNVANVTWSGQDSFNTNAILKCYNTPVFTGTTRIGCYPPEILPSTISGSTSEAGSTATFTVALSSEPRSDVTIPVASSDTTEGSVTVTELTFTPADWFVAQTVTVTGVDDAIVDGDISYNIVLGSSVTTDPDYDNITVNVAVVNTNYEIPETNQTLADRINNGEDVTAANTSQVTDMGSLFASNTTFNQDISGWDTSSVTNMYRIFYGATAFNQDISGWDVSSVTNMTQAFSWSGSHQHNISGWDVSSVTNMTSMFESNTSVGVDMSTWDVSSVTSMSKMFYKASNFNSSVAGWNTSSVTDMSSMFSRASVFNQDISAWNTSSVTYMYQMFYEAYAFNSNIGNWNTSSVTSMHAMFQRASAFNQPIGSWDTSSVTDIKYIFMYASSFDQDLSGWDTGSIINMGFAFYNAAVFNSQVNTWNTSSVTNMSDMFKNAMLFSQDVSGWDVSSVTIMHSLFEGSAFNQDISAWVVGNATDMSFMFFNTPFSQDISTWNVSNVTNMDSMLRDTTLFNQDISGWNVANVISTLNFNLGSILTCENTPVFPTPICAVPPSTATVTLAELQAMIGAGDDVTQVDTSTITDMNNLFYNNRTFNQAIGNWNTSAVTNMSNMFNGAYDFNQDISAWDTSSVTNMSNMFYEAYDFNSSINAWNVSNVTTMSYMFFNTLGFNQPMGSWNVSSVTNMHGMLRSSWKFNQDISAWDVSNVTTMEQMLWNATDFNQDISGWDVTNVASTSLFSTGTALTCENTPVFPTPICTPTTVDPVTTEIFSQIGENATTVTDPWVQKTWTTSGGFENTSFRIYFHYLNGNSFQGDMAIDLVKVGNNVIGDEFDTFYGETAWTIIPESVSNSTITTLDDAITNPNWTVFASNDAEFMTTTGRTPTGSGGTTGPDGAFSGSYYMYAETSGPGADRNFWARSSVITTTGTTEIISAYIHAFGGNIGTLRAYVVPE